MPMLKVAVSDEVYAALQKQAEGYKLTTSEMAYYLLQCSLTTDGLLKDNDYLSPEEVELLKQSVEESRQPGAKIYTSEEVLEHIRALAAGEIEDIDTKYCIFV